MAYGANRWKRVEALADEFAKYWKHYMYHIGDTLEKWTKPQDNARIGDMVLMRDKNEGSPRQSLLAWCFA